MKRMYFVPEGAMLILIAIFTVLPKKQLKDGEKDKAKLNTKMKWYK